MSVQSVTLKNLKPNPFRNFSADPIDEAMVKQLTKSIDEHEYWVGAQARRNNGDLEIVFGHHRIAAAIAAGLKHADVQVFDELSDTEMVRRFASENATQRGNTGTAQVGTIAAAIKYLAKIVLDGSPQKFLSRHDVGDLRARLASKDGMGQSVIVDFLDGVHGINDGTVQQGLANLKSSGVYAKIIAGVEEDIKRENAEALAKLKEAEEEQRKAIAAAEKAETERKEAVAVAKAAREEADKKKAEYERRKAEEEAKLAEKRRAEADKQMDQFKALQKTRDTAQEATAASAAKPITFDHAGVTKHINTPYTLNVFRQIVTGPGVSPYLPVRQQAALAKDIVAKAKKADEEITGDYLREQILPMVTFTGRQERRFTQEDLKNLENNEKLTQFRLLRDDFVRACRGLYAAGFGLGDLMKAWPKGLGVPVNSEFVEAVKLAKKGIDEVSKRVL